MCVNPTTKMCCHKIKEQITLHVLDTLQRNLPGGYHDIKQMLEYVPPWDVDNFHHRDMSNADFVHPL